MINQYIIPIKKSIGIRNRSFLVDKIIDDDRCSDKYWDKIQYLLDKTVSEYLNNLPEEVLILNVKTDDENREITMSVEDDKL